MSSAVCTNQAGICPQLAPSCPHASCAARQPTPYRVSHSRCNIHEIIPNNNHIRWNNAASACRTKPPLCPAYHRHAVCHAYLLPRQQFTALHDRRAATLGQLGSLDFPVSTRLTAQPKWTHVVINVETIDLAERTLRLPMDRVGMVIAQPHIPLESLTTTEPFCCTPEAKPQRLAMLTETLTVSLAARHGEPKTHFTVFPEYSIPGIDGIAHIEAVLQANNWPPATIVIGGIDALDRTQYLRLLQDPHTHVDQERNGANSVPAHCWINCAITWIKTADGTLERWLQPKLHPAWEQMNVHHEHMFRGSSVYVFKGLLENDTPFRFGTLVCFDWIASVHGRTPSQWILADLHGQANGGQIPLSWLFVIQHNKKPSHDNFLTEVTTFFNQTEFPNATRHNACLVFANTAGKPDPGRTDEFGACSIVLSPHTLFKRPCSVPTFSDGGSRFRDGSRLLQQYNDFVFRERGACIHSFSLVNPASLIAGPAGRAYAVNNAYVCPISGAKEPRAPAAPVPAPIKWLNDELDDINSLSVTYQNAPLADTADEAHTCNQRAIRSISSKAVLHAIVLAAQCKDVPTSADEWNSAESAALTHLVHTLDIIAIGLQSPTFEDTPAHAVVHIDGEPLDLCAIRGASHEKCIEHLKRIQQSPRRKLLLISRDPDNTHWDPRFGNFLQPVPTRLHQEHRITEPSTRLLHLGYQDVLTFFRTAATIGEVSDGIKTALAA